jgi:AsmA protein
VDVDNALKKYERSQNFNLTDLGAVLVAGPVGLVATKGTDFVALASIKLDSSKHTDIQTLYTRWKFENSQLITEDVAFATTKNRIAFDGSIDFKRDTIPGITIAVVDKNGCSLMDQNLYGKIGAIKTGKLNITKTLLGSVINFVNAVVGKDCQPIYTGSVKAPAEK